MRPSRSLSFAAAGLAPLATAVSCIALLGCAGEEMLNPVPVEADPYDVQRYELVGAYDWGRDRLAAAVDITLTPLDPATTWIVLDSEVTEVKSVRGRFRQNGRSCRRG